MNFRGKSLQNFLSTVRKVSLNFCLTAFLTKVLENGESCFFRLPVTSYVAEKFCLTSLMITRERKKLFQFMEIREFKLSTEGV